MDSIPTELSNLTPVNLDAGQVFSGKPSGTIVRGYDRATAYTPAIDMSYVMHGNSRDVIVWFLNEPEPLYVYGPLGAGKSSCVKQLAARLNYPVFEVTGHGRLEFADLVGHHTVQNGSMHFEYGPLALAMRYGGLLLLNEIDVTAPEVAAGLNSVLDGAPLCIAENGGELVTPDPMFRFVATANSNGGGDDTGLYQGVQRQNAAFLDRFTFCQMSYPDAQVEQKLLRQHYPSLPAELCDKMVTYANEVRSLFMAEVTDNLSNSIEVTFSTRSLLRWACLTVRYQPLARQGIQPITYALDRALAYRASRETRAMLYELVQRVFPQNEAASLSKTLQTEELSGEEAVSYLQEHFLISKDASHCVFLKMSHTLANGETSVKRWIGRSSQNEFSIEWGRMGQAGQEKKFSTGECTLNNPARELMARSIRKLREGYALVIEKSNI